MNLQLKRIRIDRGFSQEELAQKLGIKTSRYGTWERGERMMNLEQAYNCAVALGCTIDEIAGMPPRGCTYADAGQRQINDQYEDMNARGRTQAVDQVDNIHSNPKNRKSGLDAEDPERRSA